jgi:glutathione-regulated potassium-efflux system ancillary protein KefC
VDHPQTPVILVGYSRFGQIIGRLLRAADIKVTILDHDPDQIEFLRGY